MEKHHNETSYVEILEKPLMQRFLFYIKENYEVWGTEYKDIDYHPSNTYRTANPVYLTAGFIFTAVMTVFAEPDFYAGVNS